MVQNYAFVDYGMYLNDETSRILAKTVCGFEKADWEEDSSECIQAVYEKLCDVISVVGQFSGVVAPVNSDGSVLWDDEIEFDNDTVYYIPLGKEVHLFKAPYENIDEIVAEFKEKIGKYLPSDFDYTSNLYRVFGTFWCD